jgi:hypothetical protein
MSGLGETVPRARRTAMAAVCGLLAACGLSSAQDFTVGLADVYEDLTDISFSETFGLALKGGFQFGAAATAVYNSNLFLTDTGEESDVSLNLSPWIAYTTDPEGGSTYAVDVRYAPSYRMFLDNSQFDGLNHDLAAAFRVTLPRTSIRTFLGYSEASASDRLAGGFVQATLLRYGVSRKHELRFRREKRV